MDKIAKELVTLAREITGDDEDHLKKEILDKTARLMRYTGFYAKVARRALMDAGFIRNQLNALGVMADDRDDTLAVNRIAQAIKHLKEFDAMVSENVQSLFDAQNSIDAVEEEIRFI